MSLKLMKKNRNNFLGQYIDHSTVLSNCYNQLYLCTAGIKATSNCMKLEEIHSTVRKWTFNQNPVR